MSWFVLYNIISLYKLYRPYNHVYGCQYVLFNVDQISTSYNPMDASLVVFVLLTI